MRVALSWKPSLFPLRDSDIGHNNTKTQMEEYTVETSQEMEKEMATHSSVLACRIPGTGEPGGLPSLGSHRVGHD